VGGGGQPFSSERVGGTPFFSLAAKYIDIFGNFKHFEGAEKPPKDAQNSLLGSF
jgi:hypothetical protein